MGRNRLVLIAFASLALPGCSGEVDATAAKAETAAERPVADSSTVTSPAAPAAPADPDSAAADSLRRASEIEVRRETFVYTGGNRDPFVSLINIETTGPEIGNMELVGVYQDLGQGGNSVVVLREKVTAKRHKLRVGDRLGRARLVQIRPRDAVFMIEDFGFERQETLSLRRQEDVTP